MSLVRIAHLSDPHFGTILPGVREGLLASLRELDPNLVLFTGDITQRARAAQFREAKDFTRALKPRSVIAVPGNHDIPLYNVFGRFLDPYRGFRRLFKDHVEKDGLHGRVQIFGLNSTSRFRHIQGDFNLERIRRRLREAAPESLVRIAAFHHPMDCAKHVDDKNLLRGRNEVLPIFEDAGIDLMVGGHIHDPHVSLTTTRYPQARRPMIVAVAGTCSSWRTRPGAPNSFNLIDVETDGDPLITIKRYDKDDDHRFTFRNEHAFRRQNGAWAHA